ncbi:Adenylate kinase [Geodia barretti]|uniref:Adenylate kinase n=1 Tax=Geodia barretti TaxID=519541 RepID=A0AA35W310_GEOBA|nr:Adenylate kinase [Geodia barretti]
MRIVFLGPPGAGKGTQAAILTEKLGYVHLSTGDLIRDEMTRETELGKFAKTFYDKGDLVPDETVIDMIKARLAETENVILDGFPRTVIQAASLDDQLATAGVSLDKVIFFNVDVDELIGRLEKRREIEGRVDDEPEAIRNRMGVYNRETAPVVDYYRDGGRVIEVDALGTINDVQERLMGAVA